MSLSPPASEGPISTGTTGARAHGSLSQKLAVPITPSEASL
jgi:hypothetical protein